LFRNQSRNNRILLRQKAEIENQSAQIKAINASLENMVVRRTEELVRKNKALEDYAFITAHKLRAPLASILGLVGLIQRMELREEDRIVVSHLTETSKNLDTIIHSIIEAIEPVDERQ
jgi:light-regulated signal transduction histidine kinase (bacteriophytochrome)